MKNNNKGFSLVELIVVIAIMAILAAVAVVGFSVYIPKAQQASDKQMVADIEYVLSLHAQSNPEDVTGGYVILTPNGAQASTGFATDVLKATYGEDWATELKLAYGEWTDDGLLNLVAGYEEDELDIIANSTFMSTSADGLMEAVTSLTGVASKVVSNYNGSVGSKLEGLGFTETASKLAASGLTEGTDEYNNAVANLLVGDFAGKMKDLDGENAYDDPYVGTLLQYATLYAYCESIEDTTTMTEINDYMSGLTDMDALKLENFNAYVNETYPDLYADYSENGVMNQTNAQATLEMMGAVDYVTGTYTDAADLSNADLFKSASVSEQLNNYMNAVKAVSGVAGNIEIGELEAGSVVVFISESGVVTVIPNAAWSK